MKSRGHRILPVLLALGACQPTPPAAVTVASSASASAPAVSPDGAIDNSELLRLAEQALQAHRLYAPVGDNAVEFYLAARARRPDDAAIRTALTELQPYLLIATEQALERGDGAEAARLFELLRRLDPQAPALPRLQAVLAGMPAPPVSMRESASTASTPDRIPPDDRPLERMSPESASRESMPPGSTPPPLPASAPPPRPSPPDAIVGVRPPSAPDRIKPSDAMPVPASAATASPPPAPARTGNMAAAPRLLQDAQPRYPLPALRNRVEGEVDLAFVIRPDGSVGDVRLTSAQPQGVFDAAAVAVAARWRFEATGRSQPWQRTVRFRLPPQ